jgi:hypothetical protein
VTSAPDPVSLVDWHFRRATGPTPEGKAARRPDGETADPGDGSAVTAARG